MTTFVVGDCPKEEKHVVLIPHLSRVQTEQISDINRKYEVLVFLFSDKNLKIAKLILQKYRDLENESKIFIEGYYHENKCKGWNSYSILLKEIYAKDDLIFKKLIEELSINGIKDFILSGVTTEFNFEQTTHIQFKNKQNKQKNKKKTNKKRASFKKVLDFFGIEIE